MNPAIISSTDDITPGFSDISMAAGHRIHTAQFHPADLLFLVTRRRTYHMQGRNTRIAGHPTGFHDAEGDL